MAGAGEHVVGGGKLVGFDGEHVGSYPDAGDPPSALGPVPKRPRLNPSVPEAHVSGGVQSGGARYR